MTPELLDSVFAAVQELHPTNIQRLQTVLASVGAVPASLKSLAVTVSQRDQRESLGRLAACWSSATNTSPAQLSGILAAASFALETQTKAEVCWSGPTRSLSGFRSTAEAYRELVTSAKESALIMSFSLGEVENLRNSLEAATMRGVDVRLILEDFDVFKQESRRNQFAGLGKVVLEQAKIFVWPIDQRREHEMRVFGSMHVKALLVDRRYMLLTSANWTEAAMQDNMELGVVIRDQDLVRSIVEHFENLIRVGVLANCDP
ncbi:MAG: DISARM system phospholipase D-like protein DrmC [Fimbriimonadaceae bacterium]